MKKYKRLAILIIIMIILFCFYTLKGREQRDFDFCQGYMVDRRGHLTISLRVIVNVKDYEIEEMFEKVRDEYIELNGEPDELRIRLYKSRDDLLTPNYAGEKIYIKADGSDWSEAPSQVK